MFVYPPQARVDRKLPKSVIYKNAKPSTTVKELFVSQVADIIWKFKLAPETINIPAKAGYTEIQVFDILLKGAKLDPKVLRSIDKAIPYPLFFRLHNQDRINRVTAFKRPNVATSKTPKTIDDRPWVLGTYFETGWQPNTHSQSKLPLALDLRSLYEQMLLPYIPLGRRPDEHLESLVERHHLIRTKQRKLKTVKSKMKKERQFNRKVDLNTRIRDLEMNWRI